MNELLAGAALAAGSRLAKWPKPRHPMVQHTKDMAVPMPDGTVLLADMWAPAGATGREPVVLCRSPYGRRGAIGLLFGRPLAHQGYRVVSQSCRGTGRDGAVFAEPFTREADDGQATVAWLREQAWFPGRFATAGSSYLGFVQLALALDPPPELAAMVLQIAPTDVRHIVYPDGALGLQTALGWAQGVSSGESALRGLLHRKSRAAQLQQAMDGAPMRTSYRTATGRPVPFFDDWLAHHDLSDPFWSATDLHAALDRITVPTLIQTGWYDVFVADAFEQYARLRARGVDVALTAGPWTHASTIAGWSVILPEMLQWLDTTIGAGGPARRAPVRIKPVDGEWQDLDAWPPVAAHATTWTLPVSGPISRTYDPRDPTPSVGGNYIGPGAGKVDNAALERRPDVVTFTGEPLAEERLLAGTVRANLSLHTDGPGDLFVRLCAVDAEGKSTNLTDRLVRRTPGVATACVELLPSAARLVRGTRLRLIVAGGAHPRFARNPGTGEAITDATTLVPRRFEIHPPSTVELPFV